MHLTYVALHDVTWCTVRCTQNLRREGSSFMWHQPCQRCKYTTSVNIHKRAIKCHSCRIPCERSESARERRIALCIRGRPWAPVPNEPTVSVDGKQHFSIQYKKGTMLDQCFRHNTSQLQTQIYNSEDCGNGNTPSITN